MIWEFVGPSDVEGLLLATFEVLKPERQRRSPVEEYAVESVDGAFARSRERFTTLVAGLGSPETGVVTHAELEERIGCQGRELLRCLLQGPPIATGIIEGACRHLVKDRMDITGARWGLAGAEAILQLRALTSNGDFDEYWTFHRHQEHRRVHQTARRTHHQPQLAA